MERTAYIYDRRDNEVLFIIEGGIDFVGEAILGLLDNGCENVAATLGKDGLKLTTDTKAIYETDE